MLARTLQGLSVSLRIGLLGRHAFGRHRACPGAPLDPVARGRRDRLVSHDAALSLPHLVALILIAFALGGGAEAVAVAVALTHWPRLARVLRAELLAVLHSDYVAASRGFGRIAPLRRPRACPAPSPAPARRRARVLLPHAILHEAALTFLGFGLEPPGPRSAFCSPTRCAI